MTEWQPIATAPTDRDILAFISETKEMFVVCHGTQPETGSTNWVIARFNDGDCVIAKNPTHWMELPNPPTTKEQS